MSSSYGIFQIGIARILSKYTMESPQSVHFYDVVRSVLCYFVDLESAIELLKTKQYFFKSATKKCQKEKLIKV